MKKKLLVTLLLTTALISSVACRNNNVAVSEESEIKQLATMEVQDLETSTGDFAKDAVAYFKLNFKDVIPTEESVTEFVNGLSKNYGVPFELASVTVEPGELAGFNNPVLDFKTGVQFGPMISSIPFIGYVFELEESSSVDAFVEAIKDSANLRWNICTEADTITVCSEGNSVMFIMHTNSFEE